MRILTFGSVNLDEVYGVPHFVQPGETLASDSRTLFCGGKGLNQAIALARAGADVYMAGCVGSDGGLLTDVLRGAGVDISLLEVVGEPTGRAIIQVAPDGQNGILLFAGANRLADAQRLEKALDGFSADDWLLLQNEVGDVGALLACAKAHGIRVAFNPSPLTERICSLPLDGVDCLLVNRTEGEALANETSPAAVLRALRARCPRAEIVLTLGSEGAWYAGEGIELFCPAESVRAVDTTGAGDTFTGFFLALRAAGRPPEEAMRLATHAAAIAVTRHGASPSIPTLREVMD